MVSVGRYRRRSKIVRVGKIPNRVDIKKRPDVISEWRRYRDWEADVVQERAGSRFPRLNG